MTNLIRMLLELLVGQSSAVGRTLNSLFKGRSSADRTLNSCDKSPEFESGHPRGPGINICQNYISEAVIVGCSVYSHPWLSVPVDAHRFTETLGATGVAGFLLT